MHVDDGRHGCRHCQCGRRDDAVVMLEQQLNIVGSRAGKVLLQPKLSNFYSSVTEAPGK